MSVKGQGVRRDRRGDRLFHTLLNAGDPKKFKKLRESFGLRGKTA